jgi:hypothetical protein
MELRKAILITFLFIVMIYSLTVVLHLLVCSSSGVKDLYDLNAKEWKVVYEAGLYYPVYKVGDKWHKVKYWYDEGSDGIAYDFDVGCHGYSQTVSYNDNWFAERYIYFVKLGVISPL